MFSLQKLLGKEDVLFNLLEASAGEARASVQALVKFSKDLARATGTEDSAYARHRDRQLTAEINTALCTSFVTSIQREDVQALSIALYRISKSADKFIERALIAPRYLRGVDFSKQVGFLDAASELVLQLVQSLRSGMNTKQTQELTDQLKSIESQADKLMLTLYQELVNGRYDAVHAVFLKDLYELLERGIDRCRTAGNVISRIVLKNS